MSKEALYELEKTYPKYIEEIFEFAPFRLKKLFKDKELGMEKLKQNLEKESEMMNVSMVRAQTEKVKRPKLNSFKLLDNRKGMN